MRLSWNWLGDFVDLAGLSPRDVADRLTLSGVEVEGVATFGQPVDGVVVARVVTCEPHPNADKLRVCTVDDGSTTRTVVCGAPNVTAGAVVPMARPGARLPDGTQIGEATVRGVASAGMLCSERELGLSDDHGGLMLLDPDTTLGAPLHEAIGSVDTVLEISATPNRGDVLSVRGVAREVAALFGRQLRERPTRWAPDAGAVAAVTVRIHDAACGRYACAVVRGVRIAPSPTWMQQRLRAVGQRPVNNVVDMTNYVLLEQGQPLHAFDLSKIGGAAIHVRRARPDESIIAIDHTRRDLEPTDLVICDATEPVAVAGVMGGALSEISETTTDVLIECAWFDPGTVRKAARRLALHTESSHRFERGVDVTRVPEVLARAVDVLVDVQRAAGVECAPGAWTVDAYPALFVAPTIDLDPTLAPRILGVDVAVADQTHILCALGLVVDAGTPLKVHVPAFRPDLTRPIDLVEEIGRVYGLDRIDAVPFAGTLGLEHTRRDDAPPCPQPRQPVLRDAEVAALHALRRALAQAGMSEAVHWAMVDPARQTRLLGDDGALRLRNPLGEERSAMRRTLLCGLLDGVAHNLAHGNADVALFEVGHVFPPSTDAPRRDVENDEPTHLAGAVAGCLDRHWSGRAAPADGHDIAGIVAAAAAAVGGALSLRAGDPPPWAHPGVSAEVWIGHVRAGWVGQLHPDVVDAWEIDVPVYAFEIAVAPLLASADHVPTHRPLPRGQGSTRDVALVLDDSVTFERLASAIDAHAEPLLASWSLFDVYVGQHVAAGHHSLALRATYRAVDGALTDARVESAHEGLVAHLIGTLGATRRGA